MANIFARGDREQAPIALLAKCELRHNRECGRGGIELEGGSPPNQKSTRFGVPAIEQVHPKRRAFNQKRYNISVLCRFYFYIIFSIA